MMFSQLRSCIVLVAILVTSIQLYPVRAETVFLTNGTGFSPREAERTDFNPGHWAAYYFPQGAAASDPRKAWGMDLEDDISKLKARVANNQAFERRFEK